MASFGYENTMGWWAFLSLIPLIILYLIRPKPKEMEIPSLMFFMKAKSVDKERALFKRVSRDWLFFLHIIVFALLSVSIASPYMRIGERIFVEHAVIVIDASASMNLDDEDGGESRFERAVEIAKDSLGKKNTIIVVGSAPRVGLEKVSEKEARRYLDKLRATDSRTDLGNSILLAGEKASEDGSSVFVISDFSDTEGSDIEVVKNVLKNKGIVAEYSSVGGSKVDNVGIVDIKVDEASSTVYIKNFKKASENVKLILNGEVEKEITVGPNSVEPYSFKSITGVIKIEIEAAGEDDFDNDDSGYVYVPESEKISVLLITDDKSVFLTAALTSSRDVDLDIAKSTGLPEKDYDVYVLHKIQDDNVLRNIRERVEKGASVVVHVQEDSDKIDYGNIGLQMGKRAGFSTLEVKQINRFTRDVEFGSVKAHFITSMSGMSGDEELVIVAAGESSVISMKNLGKGEVVYYGILEDQSDFKLSPSYPIFWTNLLKFLTEQDEIQDVNLKTGSVLAFDEEKDIKTPSGSVKARSIILNKAGVYEYDSRKVVANLISEGESDLNRAGKMDDGMGADKTSDEEDVVKYNLEIPIIIFVSVLLVLELIWVKMRGEL